MAPLLSRPPKFPSPAPFPAAEMNGDCSRQSSKSKPCDSTGAPAINASPTMPSDSKTNKTTDAKASLGEPRSLNDLTISTRADHRCI